jgi:hypothetical protein
LRTAKGVIAVNTVPSTLEKGLKGIEKRLAARLKKENCRKKMVTTGWLRR